MRSDKTPHIGQAISATSSSAKPRLPMAFPTPSFSLIRSVITKDTEEFRNTKNEIENRQTPRRYVAAWIDVAVNMFGIVPRRSCNVELKD